jgi:hypothetical protein
MLSVQVTWREAAIAAVFAFAVALAAAAGRRAVAPRRARVARLAREAGLLLGLYALWQFAGSFSATSPEAAVRRAAWIWHFERAIALPNEAAIQRVFLPHPLLVQALNLYYAVLHFLVLIGCLVWLAARHRAQYWRARTAVVLFTAGSLLIQLVAVAPPRLMPGSGMADTALAYGQSVYGPHMGIEADQLSAMPSVHVGWALLVAVVAVTVARSPWRWLALAYPVLTTLAVVVTANHFWLDGIAAAVLLALTLALQRAARTARRTLATRRQLAALLGGRGRAGPAAPLEQATRAVSRPWPTAAPAAAGSGRVAAGRPAAAALTRTPAFRTCPARRSPAGRGDRAGRSHGPGGR